MLSVLIDQSFCNYLIDAKQMSNPSFTRFFTVMKKEIGKWYDIKSKKLLSQIMACLCFIFKENHLFIEEEDNPSDKVVTVVEEPHGIDIDGIGNLLDLHRLIFINKEYRNLQAVIEGVGFTRKNNSVRS